MDEAQVKDGMVRQAMALAYNYVLTFRHNKAIELIAQIKNMDPENAEAQKLFEVIYAYQNGRWAAGLHDTYGMNWAGEPLDGKSIQVFCDQGMGDTINMLRYLKLLKDRWGCRIVLNCYAFYNELARLMATVPYVDEFVWTHTKCDYITNILSIPAILHKMPLNMTYPMHFSILMTTKIPDQPRIGPFEPSYPFGTKKVGIAWKSNPDNPLFEMKSIRPELLQNLTYSGATFYSLLPGKETPEFILPTEIGDMMDTARIIESMDYVVSVDTAVLHLAGAMQKKTFGLIAHEGDERWGYKETNLWYPSVRLFRQTQDGNWGPPVLQVKDELVFS